MIGDRVIILISYPTVSESPVNIPHSSIDKHCHCVLRSREKCRVDEVIHIHLFSKSANMRKYRKTIAWQVQKES